MVKSNFSFGGKLLLILLTIIIYTLAVVGAIVGVGYYAYKKMQVRDIAEFLGAGSWIAEDYTGTVETLVKDVIAKFGSGELTVNDLTEISPKFGDAVGGLVTQAENIGLFKIDTETLYATPISEITSTLSQTLVITASLEDVSSTFGFPLPELGMISGTEDAPVYFYTQANSRNEDGTFSGIGKTFTMSDTQFSYLTRSEEYLSSYTQDGRTLPVVQTVYKDLYTLKGVKDNGYLTAADGSALYLGTTQTGEGGAASTVYTRLTAGSDAVWQIPAEDGGDYVFALAENQALYIRSGPSQDPDEFVYSPVNLGEKTGTAAVREIAARYKYVPLYAKTDNGYTIATETDENGDYVIDTENGGYVIDPDYQDAAELFYLSYKDSDPMDLTQAQEAAKTQAVYVKTNGIASLPLAEAMDALSSVLDMNTLTLADFESYFGVQLSGNAVLEHVLYVPLGRFSDAMTEEIQSVRLDEVLELDENSPRILLALAYGSNYSIGEDGQIVGGSDPRTISEIAGGIDELKLSDMIEITEPDENGQGGSAKMLLAIKDWTLNDFSSKDKIDSLSLGDILDINEDSAKILISLQNVALGNISEELNNIALDDMLDLDDEDSLLSSLKNSTLKTLAEDIQELSIQSLYSDSMYEQTAAGTVTSDGAAAQIQELIDLYGADQLYFAAVGGYTPYTQEELESRLQDSGSVTLYSPYTLVYGADADMLSGYAGTPLYFLGKQTDADGQISAGMQLATGATAWKLPQQLPEGVTAQTAFYVPNAAGGYDRKTADADAGTYDTDTLWYFDSSSETMKRISLETAAYGILPEYLNNDGTPRVSLFTKHTAAQTAQYEGKEYYTSGNLFWYDTDARQWVQAETHALRKASEDGGTGELVKDADGNVLYEVTDADIPENAVLYTYGKIVGTWKYLLLKDGEEQRCTVQTVDSLVSNVAGNIQTATIGDLYSDGLIALSATEGMSVEEMLNTAFGGVKFGEMTIGQFISLAFGALTPDA